MKEHIIQAIRAVCVRIVKTCFQIIWNIDKRGTKYYGKEVNKYDE